MLTSAQIRQSFLDFFREKQHTIVPSSSLMPDSPNLLFTNAGMNQFVPIFLGERKPDVSKWAGAIPGNDTRAADTQKCIRAGGKHNDLDDVGLDTYHHTFFEMLGNWSFGDYFKKEAIEWAWELVVERWKFPPQRVYATIYQPDKGDPAERDEEAWQFWAEKFRAAGLDPAVHIVNGNKKDNFWMMGETGPCGPCSELHIDLTPAGDTRGALVNKGTAECIEIWNLVFIQFNAQPSADSSAASPKIEFVPLAQQHVDTGMGFERVTSIIQGTKGFTDFANAKISNYETDIFRPIFDELEKMCGHRYGSTLPQPNAAGQIIPTSEQEKVDVAMRVIADHIRTLSFAIADGIEPGNKKATKVIRSIARRAARYGRTLGFYEPFLSKLAPVLAREMGDVFPEIRAKRRHVEEVLKREEEAFNKTLDKGILDFNTRNAIRVFDAQLPDEADEWSLGKRHKEYREFVDAAGGIENFGRMIEVAKVHRPSVDLARVKVVPGADAFELYDTYGFPLDLTELMARERGLTVDVAGFEKLMNEQRERARAAQKKTVIALSDEYPPTEFVGYEQLEADASLLMLEGDLQTGSHFAILDTSPLYAEMGGQVGDTGVIIRENGDDLEITNTIKRGATFYHRLGPQHGVHSVTNPWVNVGGERVRVLVDAARRGAIQRHHTVTHLLHWALHEVVSQEATQKGSFVGPDKLTFDFNSAALTPAQVRDIERLVNERIVENAAVSWIEVPYADVRGRGDIMQFFGDKYGETVRVVQIGGAPRALDGYSMELCAGTHTRATGEIGLFRIASEAAIAAGVRRIEAQAGLNAYDLATADTQRLHALATKIGTPLPELEKRIDSMLAQQKELEKALKAAGQREAAGRAKDLLARAETINGTPAIIANLGTADGDTLQTVADALKSHGFKGVVVVAGVSDPGHSVALVATVSPDFTSKVQAGKIIQTIAPLVGGKGGGKPEGARGGGKDPSQLDAALAKAKTLIA
jgi:alanyl-tRNA synthetase